MDQIKKEIEYVMLISIARCGFDAMPQNYVFLKRYSLLSSYIEIINAKTSKRPTKHFEEAAKAQAESVIVDCTITSLREYFELKGRKATKALFDNNTLYWRSFMKILKSYEYSSSDKPDS